MRSFRFVGCLGLATLVWLGSLHLWFAREPAAIARRLAARQLGAWQHRRIDAGLDDLRRNNPEWDLMARTFSVLSFANLALREPARRDEYLATIDDIIDRTIHELEASGTHHFLLPYGRRRPFVDAAQRSIFNDGEIALMLAVRQLVQRDPSRRADAQLWIDRVVGQLERAPNLFGESYPDEVWIFCNTVAVAAIVLHDRSEGAHHAELVRRWVATAREAFVDRETGLLVAKTTFDGRALEGPEGSTVWLVAAMLRIIDDELARDQYTRARAQLRGSFAGFGWSREWPATSPGRDDIDSGPTIPLVGANAGASGLALFAARAFGDEAFESELLASLELAGFPQDGGSHYAAGNELADAIVLAALVGGPLWDRAGVR